MVQGVMVNLMCQLHWAKGCPYSCWASQVAQVVKNPPATAGDVGSIPPSERSPGEGNGYPLPYSYLESSMDRGAWWATVHAVTESDMTEQLSMQTHMHSHWKDILKSALRKILKASVRFQEEALTGDAALSSTLAGDQIHQ